MQPDYLTVIKAELKIIPWPPHVRGGEHLLPSVGSRASTAHLSSILSLAFPTFTCVFIIPTPRQEHGRSTVIILGALLANSTAGYPLPTGNLQLRGIRRASARHMGGWDKGRTTKRSQKTGINWDQGTSSSHFDPSHCMHKA